MNCLEDEERHNSLEELSQPLPFSLGVRGGPSMSHLTSLNQVHGKDFIFVHHDSFSMYLHFLTIHVQGIAPRGGTLSSRLHDLLEAISSIDDGHFVVDLGEMISYAWYSQFSPYTIHLLQTCE